MITLEGVAARRAPLSLASLTVAWGAGVHAVLGTRTDGGPLLLALVAGLARVRGGRVAVLDGAPTDAAVRRQIAFVPWQPALPDALRVREVLEVAAQVRGEPARDAVKRLATLGIEALAPRPVRTLAPEEARAVALAEATTSARVRVLLLDEPLAGVDPRATSRLPDVLRARGSEGCAVLFTTASLRDAAELADDHVLLRAGAIAGRATSLESLASASPDGVRMRVVCSDPAALLAEIARRVEVEAVARRGSAVIARGRDAAALARAMGDSILATGVDVVEMRLEPPSLDEARVALSAPASPASPPAVTP